MALALFGKKVGDIATVSGKEWEIVARRGRHSLPAAGSRRGAILRPSIRLDVVRGRQACRSSRAASRRSRPGAATAHRRTRRRALVRRQPVAVQDQERTRSDDCSPLVAIDECMVLGDAEQIGGRQFVDRRLAIGGLVFRGAPERDSRTFSSSQACSAAVAPQLLGVHRFDRSTREKFPVHSASF